MQELKSALVAAVQKLYGSQIEPELERPEEKFGDFSTNVAMIIAKEQSKNPREVAQELVAELSSLTILAKTPEIAGPGFINFTLAEETLIKMLGDSANIAQAFKDQSIVVEYSDPNPFKVLHVGHLYTSVVGDAVSNLLELAGAKVHRVNFGGDVGLHVARTMWAMIQDLGGEQPEKLADVKDRPQWMADNYVRGNNAYEDDPAAKTAIDQLNKKIYEIQSTKDEHSPLAQIYWTTRSWSYEYFDEFYRKIGSKFDKYYPESQTVEPGLNLVEANIGKVFEKSDGAIIFKGEVHNLHTRVFINSEGLPTYETKDIGLAVLKDQDYNYDRSIIITGNEQFEYMQVVLKAIEQIKRELAERTIHMTHGMVRLPGSEKMSSRKGNIIRAEEVIEMAYEANKKINQKENADVALGAVKYAFLKHRVGADIIYDPAESVSLEGNSGPYLQYAHARAISILEKSGQQPGSLIGANFDEAERSLVRKVTEYPEAFTKAATELMPHHICTYLYELAQEFNRFYENSRIIGDKREGVRLSLVEKYAKVLESGLTALGIKAPESI